MPNIVMEKYDLELQYDLELHFDIELQFDLELHFKAIITNHEREHLLCLINMHKSIWLVYSEDLVHSQPIKNVVPDPNAPLKIWNYTIQFNFLI
jgi:hypothetical protein